MAERVFTMPDPGEGLEEGTIIEWLVATGDAVALNQPIVEVETAKAAVEIPSPFAGTIVTLHGDVGDDVAVGAPLVTFEVTGATAEEPAAPEVARVEAHDAAIERRPGGGPVRAAPPTRRLAKELRVEIEQVRGTGPDGRVTDEDVRRVAGGAEQGTTAVTVSDDLRSERIAVDDRRRAIADNLSRQAAIPQVTTFRTVECTALEAFRTELGVSPLPVVIAAICATVGAHPTVNAAWGGDHLEPRETVNVGIAVDTDRGLVVPVLQDAGRRGIAELASELHRLADGARGGGLTLDDQAVPATIAVSNTGSYGSEAGTPILSPGTSVTLALGVIAPRALVVDGEVVARPAATVSLTFDHRVLDGAAAGRFLTDLVAVVRSPERLRDLPR